MHPMRPGGAEVLVLVALGEFADKSSYSTKIESSRDDCRVGKIAKNQVRVTRTSSVFNILGLEIMCFEENRVNLGVT